MKSFRFELDIVVDGVKRHRGELVPEKDIPSGYLASLSRLNQVVAVEEKKITQEHSAKK